MTMRKREGGVDTITLNAKPSVDISCEKDIGKAKITKTTWTPGEGAERVRMQVEEQIKQQHLAAIDESENTLIGQRLATLEKRFDRMTADMTHLINAVEELNAKN